MVRVNYTKYGYSILCDNTEDYDRAEYYTIAHQVHQENKLSEKRAIKIVLGKKSTKKVVT